MEISDVQMTMAERVYVLRQLALARDGATTALVRVTVPRPGIAPPGRDAREACFEAVEHLHDVLQVDAPDELVADVRHAIGELQAAIEVFDRRATPAAGPPPQPTEQLAGALRWLARLEHQLRG